MRLISPLLGNKSLFLIVLAIFFLIIFPSNVMAQSGTLTCPAPPAANIPLAVGQIGFNSAGNFTCQNPANFFNVGLGGANQPQSQCTALAAGNPQPPLPVRYHILSGGLPRTYMPQTNFLGNGDQNVPFSCSVNLQCQDSCTAPQVIGNCNANCDFTTIPSNLQCLHYNTTSSFNIVIGGGGLGTAHWDDGSADSNVINGQAAAHAYANAGVYDISLNCNSGQQLCIKRTNVVCQQGGGGGPSPTPLPSATPKIGRASCRERV